jgi:hypothetical protein
MSNLRPGTFAARGVSGALGFTEGGKEQVAVQLEILSEEFLGETITYYGYFTEKTQERTIESLRLLGWSSDDLFDLSGIGSTEVRVVIEEEDYNGKLQLKVKWINGPGGLALKAPMSDGEARAFSARMKGAVLASKQRAPATTASRPTTARSGTQPQRNGAQSSSRGRYDDDAPPPVDDDQIPF